MKIDLYKGGVYNRLERYNEALECYEQALPTRAVIDAGTPDNPVFVQRLDGHMALANSLALKMAGITSNTPNPAGGEIVRDAAAGAAAGAGGEPTGVFFEDAVGATRDGARVALASPV